MSYFLDLNGKQAGPYTVSQLRLMLRTGQATTGTLYWADGLTEWLPLSTISDELDKPDSSRAFVGQVASIPESHCSRGIYIILGLFLGLLGVHNFYTGRYGVAACQLALNLLLFWTIFVPVGVAVWVLVELFTVTTDGKGRKLK